MNLQELVRQFIDRLDDFTDCGAAPDETSTLYEFMLEHGDRIKEALKNI